MATEGGGKEMNEIKTQFTTREGLYKLLPHSEYSRPNRVPFNSQGSNPVRVSFVNLNDQSGNGDRLCFNVGRELYFYIYKGVRKPQRRQPFVASPTAEEPRPERGVRLESSESWRRCGSSAACSVRL
ncbi:WD repeat-containing protein 20 isoform X8 [Panthera onca]|uniref:WD repeat-containing protein 20 isoform X9 n=1 Tax=Panthera onca TaxID=9690 RepID=UPI002953994A|nr:WD repeat-containing protein 20 isoform X9 [Panthera onca]